MPKKKPNPENNSNLDEFSMLLLLGKKVSPKKKSELRRISPQLCRHRSEGEVCPQIYETTYQGEIQQRKLTSDQDPIEVY